MKTSIEFEHGIYTCASSPEIFCRFVKVRPGSFGQSYVCTMFHDKLDDVGGWIRRCDQCLELDKNRGN